MSKESKGDEGLADIPEIHQLLVEHERLEYELLEELNEELNQL